MFYTIQRHHSMYIRHIKVNVMVVGVLFCQLTVIALFRCCPLLGRSVVVRRYSDQISNMPTTTHYLSSWLRHWRILISCANTYPSCACVHTCRHAVRRHGGSMASHLCQESDKNRIMRVWDETSSRVDDVSSMTFATSRTNCIWELCLRVSAAYNTLYHKW